MAQNLWFCALEIQCLWALTRHCPRWKKTGVGAGNMWLTKGKKDVGERLTSKRELSIVRERVSQHPILICRTEIERFIFDFRYKLRYYVSPMSHTCILRVRSFAMLL